jgi:hypothetical protein
MYLEGIFASDDIRMQLPEEAKKFSKTDAITRRSWTSPLSSPTFSKPVSRLRVASV